MKSRFFRLWALSFSGRRNRSLVEPKLGFQRRIKGCVKSVSKCRGKVESSAFRRVTDLVILFIFSAIPSMNIVLRRGHPSRLPFGAQPRRGPDGTRPRCEETRSGMREWQILSWFAVLKAELSTLPDRNFLLCLDKKCQKCKSGRLVIYYTDAGSQVGHPGQVAPPQLAGSVKERGL